MARGGEGGDFFEEEGLDEVVVGLGEGRDGSSWERDDGGWELRFAEVAVVTRCFWERFTEVVEEALGDATCLGGEVENLGEAEGVAGFALGEEEGLSGGDGGGMGVGGFGGELEGVAETGGFLGDGAGFL